MIAGSSAIGVAVACTGNVLISLALTVQKLAHHRQIDELHSQSSSRSSSSSPSTPPTDEATDTATSSTSQLTAIPVIVLPDSNESRKSAHKPPNLVAVPPASQYTSDIQLKSGQANEDEERAEYEVEEGAYLKSRLWWLGLVLMTVGEGGNFLSYGFAPASVVAPLGTVALIANCAFAPLLLGERFHWRDLFGVGLAIVGAVTVVYASNDTNPRLGPSALFEAILQPAFIAYTAINALLLSLLILLSRSPRWGGRVIGIDVGICALFGGYTVLSTKALSSLLSRMFLKCFEYPITWILVAVLIATSILQIKYLNKALMHFQSKVGTLLLLQRQSAHLDILLQEVIPTQFVFFSLAAIIGSAVLFQEFRYLAFTRLVNFVFGIATTFVGVYLLTTSRSEEDDRPSPPASASDDASRPLLLSVDEDTPLLIPISANPLARIPSSLPATSPAALSRIKLAKRTSTGNLGIGLNSQAGFLLMATTPPATAVLGSMTAMKRDRSASKSLCIV
ncbi:magnesium transporter, partial [Tremellales sp. Uapishka_1]